MDETYLSDLLSYSLERLNKEPESLDKEETRLKDGMRETAVRNYRAFVDAGGCYQSVRDEVREIQRGLEALRGSLPELRAGCQRFAGRAEEISRARALNRRTLAAQGTLLDLLETPALQETCLRHGNYDEALDLEAHVEKLAALHAADVPVVAELAQLCGRCARFVAESHEGNEGRHHGPGVGYGGVGPFFHAAVDATYGQRDGGYALADGMKALALDPRHLFRPNTRGRLCTHPDHDWVLERLGDLRHALSFKDFACNVETGNEPIGLDESDTSAVTKTTVSYVATALIVWRWLVECEETTPWPEVVKPGGPLGDGCTDLTVAQIAPLANALIASERSPTHFSSGLELAALAFRRAPCGVEDGCVAGHELMRKLQVVMARTADSVARESARLGFVRALALHRPRRRLDVLRQCLDAPPPSSAVAAMLLTLVTKETERAWPGKAGEKQPDEPQRPFLPAAVASVEAQIALALDPGSKPGRAAPWLTDSACAADVIGAALNALRFVLMREGCNVERMEPPSGAWIRKNEILAKSVKPAAEWAKARLAECDEDDGNWEGRMGFHHVLEVSERIVEFCEERDE